MWAACRRSLWLKKPAGKWGPQSHNCKDLNSAKNLNELGSGLFLGAHRLELNLTDASISALRLLAETPAAPCLLTYIALWTNKWVLLYVNYISVFFLKKKQIHYLNVYVFLKSFSFYSLICRQVSLSWSNQIFPSLIKYFLRHKNLACIPSMWAQYRRTE